MIDLQGKVALVTGSSRGIGAGIAKVLAEYGADVAVNYVSSGGQADAVARAIQETGSRSLTVQADVTRNDEVLRLIQDVNDGLGPIDILVNNAGHNPIRPILEIEPDQWDETLALNLKSQYLCSKAVLPQMLERGNGHIINISSISGQRGGLSCDIDYSAAKAGILGATKALARWAAPRGILVNAIAVGYVATGWEKTVDPDHFERTAASIPLGRLAGVTEIGEIVAFLCGPGGNYLVGETITANGGVHID